jgi:outer membrane protein assembly factor BamB
MRVLLALLVVGFASAGVPGAEPPTWPQFRGPAGSGVAPDSARPPLQFGPEKNLKWKVAVPPGASSPVVAGDRIFLTGFEKGKLFTIAHRCADGAELWRKQAPAEKVEPFEKSEGSPAASTPATDGKHLVVYFGSYGLLCYDLDGKEVWKHPLPIPVTFQGFGSCSSPIIAEGKVVLLRDQERDGKLLCVDLASGKLHWEAKRDGYRTSWGSACIWDTPTGKQVVVAGGLKLQGYDLKSGKLVWTVTGLPSYQATTPVVSAGRLIYAGWSYGGSNEFKAPSFDDLLKEAGQEKLGHLTRDGAEKTALKGHFDSADPNKDGKITRAEWDEQVKAMTDGKNVAFALKPGGTGDVTATHVAWTVTRGLPYIPSPLVYQGMMYLVNKAGRLSAFEAQTGKEVYFGENVGLNGIYASPVAANGHLYLCGLDGAVVVVKAGDKPQRVSAAELDDRIAASPAIAGNTLYIRTGKILYAFAERK